MSRNVRAASLAGTATIAALACMALAMLMSQHASTSSGEVRTIHLVVRDMAYHVSGHTDANPTLRVRRGDRVRIIVTNQDAGMKHDFGVDAWQTRTRLIDGIGEAVYSCTPHGAMMHGTIRIE